MIDYTIKPGTKVFCMVKCNVELLKSVSFTYGKLSFCIDSKKAGKDVFIVGNIAVTTITENKVTVQIQESVRWENHKILVLTDEVGDIRWNYRNLEQYIVDTQNLEFGFNPIREGKKPTIPIIPLKKP